MRGGVIQSWVLPLSRDLFPNCYGISTTFHGPPRVTLQQIRDQGCGSISSSGPRTFIFESWFRCGSVGTTGWHRWRSPFSAGSPGSRHWPYDYMQLVHATWVGGFICKGLSLDPSWRRGPAVSAGPQNQYHGLTDHPELTVCMRSPRSSSLPVACRWTAPDQSVFSPTSTYWWIPSFVPSGGR